MKRIENNKARISRKGNPWEKIRNLLSPFRESRRVLSGGLRNLLNGFKGFSTHYPLLTTHSLKRIPPEGISRVLFYLLLWGMMGAGCTVDNERYPQGPEREGEEVGITLRMPVETATTRALTDDDENEVTGVDILIFRPSDKQFIEVVSTDDITPDDLYNNLKTFYVKLSGEVILDLVVLGNARDILRTAFPTDEEMEGLTKEEVLAELILKYEGPWVDASGKPLRPFPMWGFRDNANVKEDEFTGEENAIRMTRMVVRIDVHVAPSAQNDFKLTEVYLYNTSLEGNLAHSTITGWDGTEHKATAPDLPANLTTKWRVDYKDSPSPITTTGISSERVIYTLEAPAGDEDKLLYTTALVVGGIYENQTWYYRIDFMEKDNQNVNRFIPLLRNHNYEINIQEVLGKGYTDPDDAFRKGMTNMELDILAWNEANMGNITFGAQYQLVVSTDSLYFYSNGREQIMNIYTDYPDGWTIEEKTNLDWLTISELSGTIKVMTPIEISATTLTVSEGVEYRTGYFYIRAGNMRKKVIIYQSLLEELFLEISPTTLIFNQNGLAAKDVTVTVDPNTYPVYLSDAGSITWAANGFPQSGLIGETTYTFQPATNSLGDQLFSTVTFSISDGTGRTTTRQLLVIQNRDNANFNITFQYTKYPAAGGNFYFDVYSEYVWEVDEANISPAGILTPVTTGEQPAGTTRYYFNLAENPLYQDQTIRLPIVSSDINFDPLVISLTQDYDKPWLTITSPSSRIINFGTVLDGEEIAKRLSVSFNLNADWRFTTSGNYNRVVASADHTISQVYPGGAANHPGSRTVIFTPYVYKPEVGTPVENTVVTGTATFITQSHSPAVSASQIVTFNTTVPTFFDHSSVVVRKTNSATGEVVTDGEVRQRTAHTVYTEIASNTLWATRSSLGGSGGQKIHTASDWNVHRESLSIPVNETWENDVNGPRDVTIYYTYNNNEQEILTYKQSGYWVKITPSDEILSGIISGKNLTDSLTHTFILEGSFPRNSIIIKQISPEFPNSTNSTETVLNFSLNESTTTTNIYAYRNWTEDEIVNYTFQYTYDGLKNTAERRWHDLAIVTQKRGNIVLSNGSSVAIKDLGLILNWAEAMGIDPKYNAEPFDAIDSDGNYIATENTGCNAYAEGPHGAGKWRLPTLEELKEMASRRNGLGLGNYVPYWSSTSIEGYVDRAYILDLVNTTQLYGLKGSAYVPRGIGHGSGGNPMQIRCVSREKNID